MKNKIRTLILGCALCVAAIAPTMVNATISNYGSDVNISGLFKYGVAWTQTDGTPARAKIVMLGDASDITRAGYAQTEQLSKWYTTAAYIGHGEGGTITIAYTK